MHRAIIIRKRKISTLTYRVLPEPFNANGDGNITITLLFARNIDLDSTSPYLPLLEEYKRRQSDVSMVLYGISLLYKNNQQLEQAKDFAERAFALDAVAYPAKMQYERLQQLANIAEGLGDNVLARRYRQMSFAIEWPTRLSGRSAI